MRSSRCLGITSRFWRRSRLARSRDLRPSVIMPTSTFLSLFTMAITSKTRRRRKDLEAVRDALGNYRTNVRKNGQAVTLHYETWPNVDIVPASRTADANGVVTYFNVPDMNRGVWIESRPKKHDEAMAAKNLSSGPSFKKLVKMIKWWNHQHSSLLQSYHIEVMALNIVNVNYSQDFSWDVYQSL